MTESKLPPLYSLTAIGVATFLGSALAAGYMLASNYSALHRRTLAIYSLWGSVAVVIILTLISTSFAVSLASIFILNFAQLFLALIVTNILQGPMLRSYEEMGGTYHPMYRAVLVAIGTSIALVILSVILFTVFGIEPTVPVES